MNWAQEFHEEMYPESYAIPDTIKVFRKDGQKLAEKRKKKNEEYYVFFYFMEDGFVVNDDGKTVVSDVSAQAVAQDIYDFLVGKKSLLNFQSFDEFKKFKSDFVFGERALEILKPAFDLIEQIKKQSPVAWAYYNSDNAMNRSTTLLPVVEYRNKYFIVDRDKKLKHLVSVYRVFKEKPTYMLEKSYAWATHGKILLVPLDGSPEATIPEWLAKKFYYKENEFFLIKEKTGWWRPVKKIELVKS